MSSSPTPNARNLFARAGDYERLRGGYGLGDELVQLVVREGDLRGRRVLDVGCGTGTFLVALKEIARVWGVDASPEMVAVAREKLGGAVKLARAEQLPFKNGWFERVTMNSVVHLFDMPRAFAEARRVLAADGRIVIRTVAPSFFDGYWLFDYFPSMEAVDRARMPSPEKLEQLLLDARFADVRHLPRDEHVTTTREQALERLRGRHISTFDHISEEEYSAGVARAERELPGRFEYDRHFLVVVAECATAG